MRSADTVSIRKSQTPREPERDTAGALLPVLSPGLPASDSLFGSPQEVTRKDYIQFDQEYYEPNIRYA